MIVATNIAETSLTIPRVRYVIDTGLARISRYNPRTRTKRLPVEAISQSSANQRAGRAGRIQDGICIRLYDEEDFQRRPRFTQPEIQRANLAEVILRMKAFRLGEIESFPFLNAPLPAAIRAGYALLYELGALNEAHELTALGRELARLPVDPTLGRMLLQARHEGALPDVLVIAAGLSVPDPRERPDDAKEAAAAAHSAFDTPHSDFTTLLAIWRAMPANPGRNALRRFAKSNYLSQARLREWRDIHAPTRRCLGGRRPRRARFYPAQQCRRRHPSLGAHRIAGPDCDAQGTQSLSGVGQPAGYPLPRLQSLPAATKTTKRHAAQRRSTGHRGESSASLDRRRRNRANLATICPHGGTHQPGVGGGVGRASVQVQSHGTSLERKSGACARVGENIHLRVGDIQTPRRLWEDRFQHGDGVIHPWRAGGRRGARHAPFLRAQRGASGAHRSHVDPRA